MLLVRRYSVDGEPVALTRAYLTPAAKTISWHQAEEHTVVQILDMLELPIATVELKIRADIAGGSAEHLGLQAHQPMLVLERISTDAAGQPLEFTSWFMRSDAYEFGMSLRGPFVPSDGFLRSLARVPA